MNLHRTLWTMPGIVLILTSSAMAQQAGSLRGIALDREFGTPVGGATVRIVETGARVVTNEQGNFSFAQVAPGKYTIVVHKDGFARRVKQDVLVSEGQLADVEIDLAGEFEDMDEYVVQEVLLGGTEAAMLALRMDSPALLDSIGAEIISRSGASDAAAALLLVPGASVQDGKYAVIRGLPDRYVSAQLDGVRLPTADAERRAVQLDQFPTAVIESVQVSKTFTPDQQGDASGGAINIDLKDIPDETSFQFKSQANVNSQATGSDFLSYRGGGVNHWGTNQGRGIPSDSIGSSWPSAVGTETTDAPFDYKWSTSGGGKWELDEGVKFGGFASFFYERDSSYFDNGIEDSYFVNPGYGVVPEFFQGTPSQDQFQSSLLDVTQGSESVQWGGLGSMGIETDLHKIGATFLYTRLAEDTAVLAENTRGKAYFTGPEFSPGNPVYDPNDPTAPGNNAQILWSPYQRMETLEYTETTTSSVILKGEHKFDVNEGDRFVDEHGDVLPDQEVSSLMPILDWRFSMSEAVYDQPDKTQFSAQWLAPSADYFPDLPGVWMALRPAENINLGWVQHVWQKIEEDSTQLALNAKVPFETASDREGYLKTGLFHDQVDRTYTQDTFTNGGDPDADHIGAWDDPWSVVFPDEDHPIIPSIYDVDYDGHQLISAVYAMVDMPLGEQFNVIGGLRLESTNLTTEVYGEEGATWFPPGALVPISFENDPTAANVDYAQDDALPQIGMQWQAHEKFVVRANFAQTIARQTFREITPILQQEFLGGPIFIGNPELTMSGLDNYDVRADYTPYDGWLVSGSVFYKSINLPIEYAQFNAPQNFLYTSPVNYPEGSMLGLELESRVKMGEINEGLNGFKNLRGLSFGANATIIRSEVTLPHDEQEALADAGFAMATREMTGAPNYIVNLNSTYDLDLTGTQLGLFYTLQGDTLEAGAGMARENFVPNIFALPYGTLNFTASQELTKGWKVFFQAKNILNPEIQTVYRSSYIGDDVLNTSYTAGVDFTVGVSFQMEF